MTKVSTAKPALFDVRPEWQAREEKELDLEHVAQLVGVLEEGGELPPLSVVKIESGALAVVDGYHRFRAYIDAERDRIPFEIVAEGEERIPFHLGHANSQHGRGRSSASKRRSVLFVLESPEGGDLDNVAISRWCGVSVNLVRSVRAEVRGAPSASAERRQVLDGERAAEGSARVPRSTAHAVRNMQMHDLDGGPGGATPDPKRANARSGRPRLDPEVPSRPEPPISDAEPLPFEPEWRGVAQDCDAVANGVLALRRAQSAALKRIPGGQEIVDLLARAHGIATRRKPQACPVPHDNGPCFICSDKGFVIGDPGNWQAQLAAQERAHA